MSSTAAHPATLNKHIADIKAALVPPPEPPRSVAALLSDQDGAATEMASRLESLTAHFDQMSRALQDEESGQSLSDDDMLSMAPIPGAHHQFVTL